MDFLSNEIAVFKTDMRFQIHCHINVAKIIIMECVRHLTMLLINMPDAASYLMRQTKMNLSNRF